MTTPSVITPAAKNPSEWKSAGEPMTGRQRWYLKALTAKLKMELDENLTKAEASALIDKLRAKTIAKKD